MLRCRPLLAITLLCSCRLLAQSGTLRANRASQPPSLGAEESWAGATTISAFRQREPYEGLPATEKTEVSVLYDRRFLYIRAHCFDSQPNRIVATELPSFSESGGGHQFSPLHPPQERRRSVAFLAAHLRTGANLPGRPAYRHARNRQRSPAGDQTIWPHRLPQRLRRGDARVALCW